MWHSNPDSLNFYMENTNSSIWVDFVLSVPQTVTQGWLTDT